MRIDQVIRRLYEYELCLIRSSGPRSNDQKGRTISYDIRHSNIPTCEHCLFCRCPQGGDLKRWANRGVSHHILFLLWFCRIYQICGLAERCSSGICSGQTLKE